MIDFRVEFTSLCRVSIDSNGQVWLNRLADVKDGKYVIPEYYENMGRVFENRDRIFRRDGPSYEGAIGVWSWSAIPNQNNPETDYVQSSFRQELNPVRVFEIYDVVSDEQLVEKLVSGITGKAYYDCDTLFVYLQKQGLYRGVLCKKNEFSNNNGTIALRENVYALPLFDIPVRDVFCVKWYQQFLNFFSLGKSNDFITIGDAGEIIKDLILERLTWPLYKECISGTKKEWRHCKTMLEHICGESLYEAVALKLRCSEGQAKLAVKEFTERAGNLIEAGDVDSDVLAEIIMHHETLRTQCETVVEEQWKAEHKAEIDAAAAEVEAVRKSAETECASARKKLQELEQQVHTAKQNKASVLEEVTSAQEKLDGLLAEIEQYEALGKDTLKAVRSKIAEAQKDMAGFIAELSVVLPQPQVQQEPVKQENKRLPVWRYDAAPDYEFDDDEIEISASWKEEYAQLCDNLSRSLGIDGILCDMLAAFLYAANNQNEPLLIAGPGGREIGNAFSGSIFAAKSGHLTLENEFDSDLFDTTRKFSEKIITIHNMFHKGWSATLLQDFARSEKQILWSHPYAEDLAIEPKELYSYALPLLSECFVVDLPQNRHPFVNPNIYAKRAENFKAYRTGKKKPLRLTAWKRLKLSKMVFNRMERILSDVKQIMDQESYAKDIEILLGILPMAVLTGKREILKDLLEEEKNISREVRAEVERYIEEE